ncbi:MAG TPA: DUF1622 domain-containing protein [Chitinophagaceae bacterium]|jgi:uncharacterized membrane protein|nr:DUF1622 domain-containing protein [Chitinophagaceae bacterium]
MEETMRSIARFLSYAVEGTAALVIGISLLRFLRGYTRKLLRAGPEIGYRRLRVQFGTGLTLALELLLAADILETAVAPTWDDIGKLAAIAAIRTVLNYFLEKELKDLEREETGAA